MIKLGAVYRDVDGFFRTCSILGEQDRPFICVQFGLDIEQTKDIVYVICQRVRPSLHDGAVFVLPAQELLSKTEVPLVCHRCLYYRQKELPSQALLCFCALEEPLPVPYTDTDARCAQFRLSDMPYSLSKTVTKHCIALFKNILQDFDVDNECITQNGNHILVSGCVGGRMCSDEFDLFLAPYRDETVEIIMQYWDREKNTFYACPSCFSVPKHEFDYTFYRFLCSSMYTAFIFPTSRCAVVVHAEGIYRFPLFLTST